MLWNVCKTVIAYSTTAISCSITVVFIIIRPDNAACHVTESASSSVLKIPCGYKLRITDT